MSKPARNSAASIIQDGERTFFVTSRTVEGKALLQSDRMATLFIDVLRSYVEQRRFAVNEFVVMRDHVHLIITVDHQMSIEKVVQLIKGNFSYRAGKEFGLRGTIWQRGFSEVRILDRAAFLKYKIYIEENPVKAGLVQSAADYPYCFVFTQTEKQLKLGAGVKTPVV